VAACSAIDTRQARPRGLNTVRNCKLCDYFHLNPVPARIIRPALGERVLKFPRSGVTGGFRPTAEHGPTWMVEANPRLLDFLHSLSITYESFTKITRQSHGDFQILNPEIWLVMIVAGE